MNRKEYSLVSRRSTDFGVEVSSIIDSFSRFVDGMKEINVSNGNYSLMADEIELWEEQKAGKCMIQPSSI